MRRYIDKIKDYLGSPQQYNGYVEVALIALVISELISNFI